jgi:hypothetical protein
MYVQRYSEARDAGPNPLLVVAEGARHLIANAGPETIVEGVVSIMAAARE